MGQGVGENGAQGCVCSGAQCPPAMGCRMHMQWDMVSLCNKVWGVHAVRFGVHMQQGTEVSPVGCGVCVQ